MKTALFISPHLDDAAFSCGGTLSRLSAEGWRTVLATIFTRSVPDPQGFALQCQLDKGLPVNVDYMALRRKEDREFAERVGVHGLLWLGYPEAPHRGYGSAPALFSEALAEDRVWDEIAADLGQLVVRHRPERIFLPQALGSHVDHRQVVKAALEVIPVEKSVWYRDTPYAIRSPEAQAPPLLPDGLTETAVDITCSLETKLNACAVYSTQLGFQFGGEKKMHETLSRFAAEEAGRMNCSGAAETFLAESGNSGVVQSLL